MTHDPVRLLHDSAVGAALRRDLGAVARVDVAYDVSAGLARFETLAQGAGVARAGGASGGAIAGVLLLAGGLAAAVFVGWPAADSRSEAVAPVAVASSPVPAVADIPSPEPAIALDPPAPSPAVAIPEEFEEVEPAVAPYGPAVASRPSAPESTSKPGKRTRPRPVTTDKQGTPPADYLREARNLQSARSQLGRDAAQALALAEAGAAEFRAGTFVQEWEGVAILALFELGRPEARTRGEAFLRTYPSGTYAPRVRQALGQ